MGENEERGMGRGGEEKEDGSMRRKGLRRRIGEVQAKKEEVEELGEAMENEKRKKEGKKGRGIMRCIMNKSMNAVNE